MGRVLVIGAGGVSTVAVKKIAMNADVFTDIMVASRTKSKCDKIAADIKNVKVQTAQVDADNVQELVALFNAFKPDLVVNLALPSGGYRRIYSLCGKASFRRDTLSGYRRLQRRRSP